MRAIALTHAALARELRPIEPVGSLEMHTMHEALAREHMRQLEGEARRHRLDTVAGYRRYLRLADRKARSAHGAYRPGARNSSRPAQRAGHTAK